MTRSEQASGLAVGVVVIVLIASGPLAGGLLEPAGTPTTVGEGTATVADAAVDADGLAITPGRFGTDVSYVRVPDARVRLAEVSGHPRLVYRVEVPGVDADLTATEIVGERGRYRLHVSDYGFDSDRLSNGSYEGAVTVRVQSFTSDRTVLRRNVTVEVRG